MGQQFYHGFKDGLGPWTTRETGRGFPSSPECAKIRDGKLVLSIRPNPLRTGHIWVPPTEFMMTKGYVEARIKFRGGLGAHGSVWAQALRPYETNLDHEVDVVENFGNPKVAHQGIWTQDDGDPEPDQVVHGAWRGDMTQWNVYGCEMTPTGYIFTVNDIAVLATTAYVSTNPKYLIASLLISDWEFAKYGEGNTWQQKTLVDWVRVSDI